MPACAVRSPPVYVCLCAVWPCVHRAGEEDQPLEAYLQRMKASMAARLESVHGEAMAKSNFSFSQQLELKEMELSKGNEEVYATRKEP